MYLVTRACANVNLGREVTMARNDPGVVSRGPEYQAILRAILQDI